MDKPAKLLVVAYDLPPYLQPQSIQVGRLLDRLADRYRMHVVTSDDSGSRKDPSLYAGLRDKFAAEIRIPYAGTLGAMLVRKALFPFYRLPDERRYWHVKAYRRMLEEWGSKRFDAIVTFSYPLSSNLLGMRLKERFSLPWIAFFSDPWVDSPYTRYRLLFRATNSMLEQRTVAAADRLVFSSVEMRDAYVQKYPFARERCSVLEHSFDPGLSPAVQARSGGSIVFRHIGTLNRVRTPSSLLDALGRMAKEGALSENDVRFEFYGGTDVLCGRTMRRLTKQYDLDRIVTLKGSVPYQESLSVMQGADVLLVVDANVPGSVFLPSKLIDYIGAGRPVLGITPKDSASARVIRKAGGWVAPPDDPSAVAAVLSEALRSAKEGTLERHCPERAVRDEYDIANHARTAADIIDGVLR